MSRWRDVAAWLEDVAVAPLPPTHLSSVGAVAARDAAVAQLSPEVLDRLAAVPGRPVPTVHFVAARTVFTAPLEWLVVLLGRGTQVALQLPSDRSDTAVVWPAWVALAQEHGLPLGLHPRDQASTADLLVAMGGDDTITLFRQHAPGRFLGFGAKYSAAVCETEADAVAITADLVLHDGRGCMSPGMVLVDDDRAIDWFAAALAAAEASVPRGHVSAAEHAAIRSRGALAQVVGRSRSGPCWAVHELPWDRRSPASLPRAPLLVRPPSLGEAVLELAEDPRLSTLGTRRSVAGLPSLRVVPPGEQQRPPVERLHDGVDWLNATFQDPGDNGPT